MDCTVSFSQGIFNYSRTSCKEALKCALDFGDGRLTNGKRLVFRDVEIIKSFGFFSTTVERYSMLVAEDFACRLRCKIQAKTLIQEEKCQSLCASLFFSRLHKTRNII
jgi:hypothetical protein